MAKSAFSGKSHAEAEAEGWWLSERDDGKYEIQRFDDDPQRRFKTDAEAHAFVAKQAATGSPLHMAAIELDGEDIDG